jgi:hypothetical protein
MLLRLATAAALVIATGVACKSRPTAPPAASFTCEADGDCRLSCMVRDACCEACECKHPYHRDEYQAVQEANRAKCGDEVCHRLCPKSETEWVARCREGRCVAEVVEGETGGGE